MKLYFLVLIAAAMVFGQPVTIPKEWRNLDHGHVLATLDAGKYPFLVRRLAMATLDPQFSALPGPKQEDILWGVEKTFAAAQGRKPTHFLIWDSDLKNYCDQVALDGSIYEVIVLPPLLLAVSFSHKKDLAMVDVYAWVADSGKMRIDLLPQNFRMSHLSPKLELQAPIEPAKVAGRIQSRARWAAVLSQMAASMKTNEITTRSSSTVNDYQSGRFNVWDRWNDREWQGTYSGSSFGTVHTTTTTTVPDYAAQRRAAAATSETRREAARKAENVKAGALRANTLLPGKRAFGTVYFKRPKKTEFSVLTIPIGTVQLEFGVKWQR